jgi:tetratricopeptide (TPR) repeat protein
MEPLVKAWCTTDSEFPVDPRAVEAAQLALKSGVAAEVRERAAYAAGRFLFNEKHEANAALAILEATRLQLATEGKDPRLQLLQIEADCAERVGERDLQIELLERGLVQPSEDKRAQAQIAATYAVATLAESGPEDALVKLRSAVAVFRELGDIRERAVTMGKIADILQQRGETEEALRIRREEQLPVYERLGDIRSRAVTMGQIADILQDRGETEEALRIHLEECLPVYQTVQDLRGIAPIRFSCAQLRLNRQNLSQSDVQTIYEELAESFTISCQLQHVDAIAAVGNLLGQILAMSGLQDEAITVLQQSASAFDKMQLQPRAEQVRNLIQQIQERK